MNILCKQGNKYSFVDKQTERRAYPRINLDCRIIFGDLDNRYKFKAKSIDLSLRGAGIQVTARANNFLSLGDILQVWINLSNKLKPIHCFGKVVWVKKRRLFYSRAGIELRKVLC